MGDVMHRQPIDVRNSVVASAVADKAGFREEFPCGDRFTTMVGAAVQREARKVDATALVRLAECG